MLPLADHITVLSQDGHIVDHDISPTLELAVSTITGSVSDDTNEDAAVPGHGEHFVSTSATDKPMATITDAARQTGDMSVYLYYARAAGLTATVCFLSVTMACTFCESFAGEL